MAEVYVFPGANGPALQNNADSALGAVNYGNSSAEFVLVGTGTPVVNNEDNPIFNPQTPIFAD